MSRPDDPSRMWRPDAGYAPTITTRNGEPRIIETTPRSHPREVAADVADALALGEEAIVLGRSHGIRMMICRVLPQASGVVLIAPSPRATGAHPNIGSAMAEAARLVTAEYGLRE